MSEGLGSLGWLVGKKPELKGLHNTAIMRSSCKLRELVDTATRRRVNILCVQETKWKGQKAKEVDNTGFKLWYTGTVANRNGVRVLIDKSLKIVWWE